MLSGGRKQTLVPGSWRVVIVTHLRLGHETGRTLCEQARGDLRARPSHIVIH